MCFSATASFVSAAATGAAGLIALTRVEERRDWPLAAVPLFFAAQQATEGLLWLSVARADGVAMAGDGLTHTFLFFALVFWPIYAPLAALMAEPDGRRRRMMSWLLLLGSLVALYLLDLIASGSHGAGAAQGHIVYVLDPSPPHAIGIPYLLATAGALLLSSQGAVQLLALIVLTGSVTAYVAYWDAFLSVWCFFAAAASIVLVVHFERVRQMRRSAAPRPEPTQGSP